MGTQSFLHPWKDPDPKNVQLSIPDDRQSYFSVYQSEVGVFAIGGALTDSRLFELCQEYGDASGSLKFFVSTAPDRPPQYEPSYPEYPIP
jgi:hypothetical protein